MRKIVIVLSCLLAAAPAFGADARKYAAMSLLGDELDIVHAQPQIGSNIPSNKHERVALPDPTFDQMVLRVVDQTVSKQAQGPRVVFLQARDPNLYALQERILEADSGVAALLQPIKALADQQQATHLILVTKYRHDALLKLPRTHIGTGKLSGLGFYIGHQRRRGMGFLAPYAYFRISLVDLATLKVLREDTGLASTVRFARNAADTVDPWEALDNEGKARVLQNLLRAEIERILPPLLVE